MLLAFHIAAHTILWRCAGPAVVVLSLGSPIEFWSQNADSLARALFNPQLATITLPIACTSCYIDVGTGLSKDRALRQRCPQSARTRSGYTIPSSLQLLTARLQLFVVELEVAQALVDLENGVPELKTELRPLQVGIRVPPSCSRMIKSGLTTRSIVPFF